MLRIPLNMENVKKLFNKLQIDSKSILFTQEQFNEKLLKNYINQNMKKTKSL